MTDPVIVKINGTGTLRLKNYSKANTVDNKIKLIPNRKIVTIMFTSYIPRLNISMNFEVWKNLIPKDTENSQVPKSN